MKKIVDFLNEFGVFIFCFGGVLCKKAIPDLRLGDTTFILPTWQMVAGSGGAAILVMAAFEFLGGKNRIAKRKRFVRRALTAFLCGYFFIDVIEKVEQFL